MTTESMTAEAMAGRLFEASLATMDLYSVYLGKRLGLYQALTEGPATTRDLSSKTGLDERYVREWLEQQVSTGFLSASEESGGFRFTLPDPVREVLLDEESLNHMGPIAGMLVASGNQLDAIADAFKTGGGVEWSDYGPDMVGGQGAFNRPMFVHQLAQEYLPQIPGLVERLNRPGARISDFGCGYGWSSVAMARAFPGVSVDGVDIDLPSLDAARTHAAANGVGARTSFVSNADNLPAGGYDLVTAFECIHDMANPVQVLAAMRRATKPGGTVLVVDERVADTFSGEQADDIERMMYGWSVLVCLPAGRTEETSVATGTVMRLPVLERYACEAGFAGVEVLPIENDFFRFYLLR